MNRSYTIAAAFGSLFCLSMNAAWCADLAISVSGFKNDKGVVHFHLFNSEQSFSAHDDKQAVKSETTVIKDGKAFITFSDVVPGDYALRYFHDENNSGKPPRPGLGKPPEMGFSNDAKPNMNFAHVYKDAKFIVSGDDAKLNLHVASGFPFVPRSLS